MRFFAGAGPSGAEAVGRSITGSALGDERGRLEG